MRRPVHFEIHADDLDRAQAFYEGLFRWRFQPWGEEGYRLITTGEDPTPGIYGGMVRRIGRRPDPNDPVKGSVFTVDVAVVAMPKMAVPTMGWLAYVVDTEGNIFGMMQMDTEAK